MRDPFPISPPPLLVQAIQPLASTLHLSTLPLHIHEVLFALGLYAFIGLYLSPLLSSYFCGSRYNAFSRRTQINWNVHVVSFCQACIICSLSLWLITQDTERQSWRPENNNGGRNGVEGLQKRVWGYNGATGLCQSFALGYFLWDLVMCSVHVDIFGWGMLAHAVAAVSVFSLGYRPFSYFYCPIFLLYELSSPFLNIHWFCDKLDLTGSTFQAVNGGLLTTTFFLARICWGNYSSFNTFYDLYTAYHLTPPSSNNPGSSKSSSAPTAHSIDYQAIYALPPSQQTKAFFPPSSNTDQFYLPLWLPLVYLASNLILNALNIWWFYKMVATIRTRFHPPWGTKGVGPEIIHYEPLSAEEKAKIARGKGLGAGVKGAGVAAGRVISGTDGVDGDGRGKGTYGAAAAETEGGEQVEVQRGVYGDGRRTLEVTGTERRKGGTRSRRKA
ncbi:hypothetical protein LTR56_019907 [Elasticomyces elasticus]|nr:hypothetical protein LTR56_019907 [Elasticomyces elasticus]KAK3643406.1 hypothetical protein LTR22_015709 [Elasticomyces elasticus]KAK5755453.1 hypothetical protein LTS12_014438 [Elasticomyces elasticus]